MKTFKSNRFWPLGSNLFFPSTLTLEDKIVVYRKKSIFSFLSKKTIVEIKDIVFFDTSGLFSKHVNFGYRDQVFIKGISKKETSEIRNHFIANGSKIGYEGNLVKSLPFTNIIDIFKPLKWFLRETLILTDEAVIFNKKKLTSSKTTYLPYDKISVGYIEGRITRKFYILGEQNILPNYSFSKKKTKQLVEKLKNKQLEVENGTCYTPSRLSSWRNLFNPPKIFCTANEIAYFDTLLMKNTIVKVLKYDQILTYRKYKWYSIWGDVIITGNIDNIRGQNTWNGQRDVFSREIIKQRKKKDIFKKSELENDVIILLKNVWFFKWSIFFIDTGLKEIINNNKNGQK